MDRISYALLDFVRKKGVRWCPACGEVLELDPNDAWVWNNGVLCPNCDRYFSWEEWSGLEDRWKWNQAGGLVSFYGSDTDITVPDRCRNIGRYAFSDSSAVQIRIKHPVNIEPFAFMNNRYLKKVELPEGIRRIEEGTFLGCEMLSQINIPKSVVYIGKNAFSGCSALEKLIIPDGVKMIDDGAFSGTGLCEIMIPDTAVVGKHAFASCANLRFAEVKSTRIDSDAFYGCVHLQQLKLEEGLLTIGARAFYNCSKLKTLTLPTTLCDFGNHAFAKVPVISVHLPKHLAERINNFCVNDYSDENSPVFVFESSAKLIFD